MKFRCPACKGLLERDGRRKVIQTYCAVKGKNVTLRKVVKK